MSRTRFCIKEPLAASFAAAVGTGAPPSSDEPDPRPPPPVGSRPRDAAPSDETRPRAPLRLISGPRRCCPRCRREYARLRDLPRCGDPPCDIHPLGQSTHREIYLLGQSAHRENKNLGISATFLRLRTLFCPRKAKMGLHTANYLHFCASIRNWEARNNCQSQKSCNLSRFFVSGLLE